jgi:hypothetical protein
MKLGTITESIHPLEKVTTSFAENTPLELYLTPLTLAVVAV